MKKLYNSCIMAFSMYTKLPMPMVDWKEENKAYAFALFPLVGLVEMVLFFGVHQIFRVLHAGNPRMETLGEIALTILPILYTGGIHMDGFMDTLDALGSHASKERKLEIMKDSHVGSVAVIGTAFYILLYYLGMSQMQRSRMWLFGFVLLAERALSVLTLLYFPIARKDGMAADFVHSARERRSKNILIIFLMIAMFAMAWISWKMAVIFAVYFFVISFWYVKKMLREIGGLTGDTSGFFLQVTEVGALWMICLLA